ncbi:MAG: hypothetical protein J1F20_06055 [Muribaculaceae bacterium]|nr:hypothetical protein [Muribaculaceae bacterium]
MARVDHTLVTDLLTVLKVPFTADYTEQRFETMPFKTLFGVTQLLKDYGIESNGYEITDKSSILSIKTPFIAQTDGGLVIVTGIAQGTVNYLTQGKPETMPENEFVDVVTGVVLTFIVSDNAREPDYTKHWRTQFIIQAKHVILWILAAALTGYLLITNGTWRFLSVWGLLAVDSFGLWLTYMLVQKSLKIKNPTADKVCGVLQSGGCDSILKTDASSFFGIFSWSEVGFTYFGVSLLVTLIAPAAIHWLSIINICCLPFTVWSIWYQKFRAKHWCTLCVCVQASLWIQFFCYLAGRWQSPVFPLDAGFFALGATFVFVLLALNKVLPHFSNDNDQE